MDDRELQALAREREMLKAYMDHVPDWVYFKDERHRFVRVNSAMAKALGRPASQLHGKDESEFFGRAAAEVAHEEELRILTTSEPLRSKVHELVLPHGEKRTVATTKIVWRDAAGQAVGIIGITRDITGLEMECRALQFNARLREVLFGIVETSLRDIPLDEQLRGVLDGVLTIPWLPPPPRGAILLESTPNHELQLVAERGLGEFRHAVPNASTSDRCGEAIAQRRLVFVQAVDESNDVPVEGTIPNAHYCVPLVSSDRLLGLLVLCMETGHIPTPSEEDYLRTLADAVVGLIERRRAAEQAGRERQVQDVLNAVVRLSVLPLTLEQQLQRILDMVLSIEWLALERRGAIFVVDGDTKVLALRAQRGLAEPLLVACARVPFGKCLCGLAAERRDIVFKPAVDHDHSIGFEGMRPHGHYCVPIVSDHRVLGVLNTYVREGFQRSGREEQFLEAVAATLAGVIDRRRAEEALVRQANYDTTTGLPNRALFLDRLSQAVAHANRYDHVLAVLFADLDGFKAINDKHGHAVGDRVLATAGQRLSHSVRACDTVCRLGGDEFTILLSRIREPSDASAVAERLIEAMGRPFEASASGCHVGVSIGIGIFPQDARTAEGLIASADAAMYEAKRSGKGTYRFAGVEGSRPPVGPTGPAPRKPSAD